MRTIHSLAFAVSILFAPTIFGAEPSDDWSVKVTPYLWASRMHGSTQIKQSPETQIDMSFSDIMHTLDAGFMGGLELQKGRWGILFDIIYMKTSDSVSVRSPGGRAAADADVTIRQTLLSSALAYRWLDSALTVDGFAGVRYTRIKENLDLDARAVGATAALDHSQTADWTEPFFGLRGRVPLTHSLAVVTSADVGGFGLGSDLTTQAQLGLSYSLDKRFDAQLGFRYMKVDYDKGDLVYDMENEGPYLGLTYTF